MPAPHTAADALAYVRELLGGHLDWIDEALAEEYGRETIDGEEYLPDVLSDVMACLYSVHREVTEESVTVGLHMRDDQGRLYRPRTYSTGQHLYTESLDDNGVTVTRLQHPTGDDWHAFYSGSPATRRAMLRAVDGGGDSA